MAQSGTLTRRQQKAIAALASNQYIQDAAEEIQVNRHTLTRWMQDPQFKQALNDAIGDTNKDALRRLAAGIQDALDTIYQIMMDVDGAASRRGAAARLRAATTWLDHGRKLSDDELWAERVRQLWEAHTNGPRD